MNTNRVGLVEPAPHIKSEYRQAHPSSASFSPLVARAMIYSKRRRHPQWRTSVLRDVRPA